MKICIHSDAHWCQNSSIVRSRGEKYSTRLENLIQSVNWVEQLAWDTDSECIICCGDFFDSSVLNAEELSALQEIRWAPLSHLFLTGNHETNVSSLEYSTTDLFKLCPNVAVINTPQQYFIDNTTVEFCFLPYVLERDRKPVADYFGKPICNRVIFSHNDLKNVQYGAFLSTEGFEVSDIENNCDLCFNGHIHHCCKVSDKIFNVGNLTGQNFTEDATRFEHCAVILDTETLQYQVYINPHALNFYKLDLTNCKTESNLVEYLHVLKDNSVATVSVQDDISSVARTILEELKNTKLREYRLLIQRDCSTIVTDKPSINATDHLKQFEDYVLSQIGSSDVIRDELSQIMR